VEQGLTQDSYLWAYCVLIQVMSRGPLALPSPILKKKLPWGGWWAPWTCLKGYGGLHSLFSGMGPFFSVGCF